MPTVLRRATCLTFFAALALAPGACRNEPQGTARVLVIGAQPKLADPSQGPLSASDAVLVQNAAQGLVRFDSAGNIVPGLAERWNVSDDGLSYIFRIAATEWPGGGRITAQQVARILKRAIAPGSENSLKDTLGAVEDIVAMTDRVIEIRLRAPRPNLLSLLAQPELGIMRSGHGTGPFSYSPAAGRNGELRLDREIAIGGEEEGTVREEVLLAGSGVEQAVKAFAEGEADLVLGGTFANLPVAQNAKLRRNSLRFDPAMGLFGLVPTRSGGAFDDPQVRRLLSQAIDREALVAALRVPGLAPRATILEPGLEGVLVAVSPAWMATPIEERRTSLAVQATRLFGDEKPALRLFVPNGPGGDILFERLAADWGFLGLTVERARSSAGSDFRLLDSVAPSTSPAWFLRQFRCGSVPVCDAESGELMEAARSTSIPAQRSALLLQAAASLDEAHPFIALTAPIRWSLVSPRIEGFVGNRYARHTLTELQQRSSRGGF
jgi:peptide/nickel transport system substrate-binding protein